MYRNNIGGGGLKKAILFLLLTEVFFNLHAQLSVPGTPESFSFLAKSAVVIPEKVLDTIDTAQYRRLDIKQGITNRFGVVQQVNIDIKAQGVKTEIPGKGYIWQYKIQSPKAYSIGIQFIDYFIPEGSSVFIYDQNHTRVAGAFTSKNNNNRNDLAIAPLEGDNAIIEYFEPYNPEFAGELIVGNVSQAYRDMLKASSIPQVGINCPAGANWQDAKHAVCLMIFHDTEYEYFCTGFLVNNVRADGTPYFQTANHCLTTNALAKTVVTYFNYENSTCSSNDASNKETVSGDSVVATNAYSDFTLLKLTEQPPASFFPYFAGWDATGLNPSSGACIHHPEGGTKCIAIDDTPESYTQSIQWSEDGTTTTTTAPNTHWVVDFTTGRTQSGSSGSPLFDSNQRVIGQLHGGDTVSTTSYFGKFSLSWNHSTDSTGQLQHWLDPDGIGVNTLDGIYWNIKPIAQFSTPITNVCQGSTITLSDKSQFIPIAWQWTITPAGYKFVNGTNPDSKNPQVEFTDTGSYTVSLKVTNSTGSDSITKTNFIKSGNITVALSNIPQDSIICGYNLADYLITASGAENYTFTLERTDKIDYSIDVDSINLSLKSSEKHNGSFTTWLKVTGAQGTCSSSDSALLNIRMPVNDDIQYAANLYPGRNIAYSNFCGSVQSNEPYPPLSDCYSSDSWCPLGYSPQHTIWFRFMGPTSGKITIDTHGFNDRIAVYEADSASDILSGDASSYTLIASNDDRSSTDSTSLLTDVSLVPNKEYWLQVDGYQGATGNCVIDLLSNSLELFPNPSDGHINLYISNTVAGDARVEVYSIVGKLVYSNVYSVTPLSNSFNLDFSSLASGLYVIRVTQNGATFTQKFIIERDVD